MSDRQDTYLDPGANHFSVNVSKYCKVVKQGTSSWTAYESKGSFESGQISTSSCGSPLCSLNAQLLYSALAGNNS